MSQNAARGEGILGRIALTVLRSGIRKGSLRLRWPDGRRETIEGAHAGPHVDVQIHRTGAIRRLATGGGLGLAEAYLDGDFDTDDLPGLIELSARNLDVTTGSKIPLPVAEAVRKLWRHTGAKEGDGVIKSAIHHYNLGNDFYAAWLDPTMTYSSAIFDGNDASLESAQREKYRRLARGLDIRPGHRVLEIGSGWGGFAHYAAAELGAEVTTVTVSREQATHVEKLMAGNGLADRVDIRLEDFLETRGRFDRIVSIEMIESIPPSRWPEYFATLRERLVPDGRVGLQVITIDDGAWSHYETRPDFIKTYVFPGGQLPSDAILRALADDHHLTWDSASRFGSSYARTLAGWRERFESAWPDIESLGLDSRFRRLWRYYLAYCEGGFRSGRIDVGQIFLSRAPA